MTQIYPARADELVTTGLPPAVNTITQAGTERIVRAATQPHRPTATVRNPSGACVRSGCQARLIGTNPHPECEVEGCKRRTVSE